MEHLPSPQQDLHDEQIMVPFVSKEPYDGGPFLTYPLRTGRYHIMPSASNTSGQLPFWQHEKLYPTPNEELESFFQTWLFFGLLHEILGELYSPQDFIRTIPGSTDKVITTSKLIHVIETWIGRITAGEIAATYEHLAECLSASYASVRVAGPAFDQRIKISIASTGEVLAYAVNQAFHIENMVKDNKCPAGWCSLVDEASWTASMRASGWCPSQISILIQDAFSLQSLHYFAALPQPEIAGRHQLCGPKKCTAYQNNLDQYRTQHHPYGCQCEELSVNVEAIDEILREGQLPLLRIIPGHTIADLDLQIISSQSGSSYVALSHVWADGLGNPYANALPRCQLLRLHGLLQAPNMPRDSSDDQEELLLWCDTLCCPVKPIEAKNRALLQMKRTYQDATNVLVLDSSLQLYDSILESPEEMCTRILISGWTRRLWTLQEGVLGAERNRLWFQFRDKAFNIRPLWLQVLSIFNNEVGRRGLAGEIVNRTKSITAFHNHRPSDPGADLVTIDAALRHRDVSVPTDEPLLIGNLLGLDVGKILDGPNHDRVHRMWLLMPSAVHGIPKSILFRLGPRLKEEGFRWAPATMLGDQGGSNTILLSVNEGDDEGIPSSRGLIVTLSGYDLAFSKRPKGLPLNPWNVMAEKKILYMRDEAGAWYLIRRKATSTSSGESDFLTEQAICDIVLSNEDFKILDLDTGFQARADGIQQTRTSLLVKQVHQEMDVNYVQSFIHVHVALLQRTTSDMFETAYQCAQQLGESSPAQRMANLQEGEINMDLPSYKTLFGDLENEVRRIARLDANAHGLAAAQRLGGRDDAVLLESITRLLFAGHFAHMGRRTGASQKWCVD